MLTTFLDYWLYTPRLRILFELYLWVSLEDILVCQNGRKASSINWKLSNKLRKSFIQFLKGKSKVKLRTGSVNELILAEKKSMFPVKFIDVVMIHFFCRTSLMRRLLFLWRQNTWGLVRSMMLLLSGQKMWLKTHLKSVCVKCRTLTGDMRILMWCVRNVLMN